MPKRSKAGTEMVQQEYEVVAIDEVHPHPDNPNSGDLDLIGESISENGWYGAVIVQRSSGRILAGNHRWAAARAAGATEIPVIYKDVDDVVALRILLADNETARQAVVDMDQVSSLLRRLGSVKGTGFRALEALARDEEADEAARVDEDPELDTTPGENLDTQYGVIVMVDDEAMQEEVYTELKGRGFTVRTVSV